MLEQKKILILLFSVTVVVIIFFQNCSAVGSFQTEINVPNQKTEDNSLNQEIDRVESDYLEITDSAESQEEGDNIQGCGNPVGVSISKFKSTDNYYNVTETGTITPGTIMSFPFVVDSVKYPFGITIEFEAGFSSGSYNAKDVSISKCPGKFDSLPSRCISKNSVAGRLVTDPIKELATCKVEHGVTYYFNIRPTFTGNDAAAVVFARSR